MKIIKKKKNKKFHLEAFLLLDEKIIDSTSIFNSVEHKIVLLKNFNLYLY